MNEKLKENVLPYPFCGNTDCVVDSTVCHHYVTCLKCEARGPMEEIIQGARDAWDKRTEQAAAHRDDDFEPLAHCMFPED